MSKKRYPDEFKIEAVKQVVDASHSVADVAGGLGMTTHSLYAWISKFGPDSRKHIAKSDDQVGIRRLKKELKRTTEERDLLKKAAVYFANQSEGGTPLSGQSARHHLFADSAICLTCTPVDITPGCVSRDPSGTLQIHGLPGSLSSSGWRAVASMVTARSIAICESWGKVVVRTGFIV